LIEAAEMMRPERPGERPEVRFGPGAKDLGSGELSDPGRKNESSAPHPVLSEAGDDADGDVDT